MDGKYSIKVASRKAGLSPHLIRAWERRYGAVVPQRTPTNRRLYSDDDIERLILLRRATLAGESIGQAARFTNRELKDMVGEGAVNRKIADGVADVGSLRESEIVDVSIDFVRAFDAHGLRQLLLRSESVLSKPRLLENIIIPFLKRVGEMWESGSLKVAHEHLVSAEIRSFLGEILARQNPPETSMSVVVTTPAGQDHEFGAIIATLIAISEGWRAVYLGPDLPAEEIAYGVVQNNARSLALSIVYPPDDPQAGRQLVKIRSLVGEGVRIIIGGRSARSYRKYIDLIGASLVSDMHGFRLALRDTEVVKRPG